MTGRCSEIRWWRDDETVTPEEARRRLARVLYEALDRADPEWPLVEWDDLSRDDQNWHLFLIESLMDRRELMEKALKALPDNTPGL